MIPLLLLINHIGIVIVGLMIVAGLVRGSFFASQLKTPRFVTSSRRQWRSLDFFQVSSEDSYDQEHPTISSSGTVVARILPKKYIDYERIMKPLNRREDITIWRERVIPNNNKTSSEKILIPEGEVVGNGNQEDMVVVLDVDLITKIWNEYNKTSEPIHVQLHMHRQANETAQRTLQRTEISTRRKIDSFRTGRRKSSSLYSRASNSSTSSDDGSVCLMVCSSSADSVSSYEDDPVELLPDGYTRLRIDNDATSNDLWRELVQRPKSILWLDVLKEESPGINLLLDPCPPTVLSVRTFEDFSADIFNGVPLVIETEVLHAERALIIWFVGEKQVCYDSHCYTPTLDDIGKKVTVFISPIRPGVSTGYEEAYGFEQVVQKRPEMPVVERRLSWLARRSDDDPTSLRVMSYNLLADLYASREIDQRSMYNHCQAKFIKRTRRMPLLVYEILVHQPDIVCLQEVDASIHKHILLPVLKAHGYYGYYSNKASSQLEGCSIFWNLKCFEKEADQEEFALRDLFEKSPPAPGEGWESMEKIHSLLQTKPELHFVIKEKVGQVLQVATLRPKNLIGKAEKVVVGNTHLFYHPMADHIRAMQAFMVCKQMDEIRRRDSPPLAPYPLIICGDLNSDPLSGAVRMLLNREVGPEHFETWKNLDEYSWEKGECDFLMEHGFIGNDAGDEPVYIGESFYDAKEKIDETPETQHLSIVPPRISLPDAFPNLFSGYTELPEFTNYAVDFAETLDYVLASKTSCTEPFGFEVISSAPVPPKSEMEKFVAMPNENMPSDHVSIACDLRWKRYK